MTADVLLHLPHASTHVPEACRGVFPPGIFEAESRRLTDWFTDDLYDLPGADRLVFPVSRLLVDPERFRDDAREPMAARGMGAVYVRASDGRPLKGGHDREALLREFYDPHHARLEAWADAALAAHGRCLVVDAHSYPSVPLPCDFDQRRPRSDACVGTDPFHTPPALRDAAVAALASAGWSVGVDRPYSGAIVPLSRYRRDARVSSVIFEVSRALYLDEDSAERAASYPSVRSALREALDATVEAWRRSV